MIARKPTGFVSTVALVLLLAATGMVPWDASPSLSSEKTNKVFQVDLQSQQSTVFSRPTFRTSGGSVPAQHNRILHPATVPAHAATAIPCRWFEFSVSFLRDFGGAARAENVRAPPVYFL
jgi:hypothetical protein